jgi:hypothetical protein
MQNSGGDHDHLTWRMPIRVRTDYPKQVDVARMENGWVAKPYVQTIPGKI